MEDKELEQIKNDAAKGIFKYTGIDPEHRLSGKESERELLIQKYKLDQLVEYEGIIKKAQGNPSIGVRENIGAVLFGPEKGEQIGRDLEEKIIRDAAKQGRKHGEKRMAEWVRNNWNAVFDKIEDSDDCDQLYMQMALTVPLLSIVDEDGKEREDYKRHNTAVKFLRAVQDAQAALKSAQDGDTGKMRKVVESKIKDQNVPEWGRKLLKAYINDQTFLQLVFQEEYQARQQILQAALTKDGKNPDKDKIKDLINDSAKEAWRLHNKETDKGRQKDIFEKGIAPMYNRIADAVYQVVTKEYQKDMEDEHPEIKKANERAAERKAAGMGYVPGRELAEQLEGWEGNGG